MISTKNVALEKVAKRTAIHALGSYLMKESVSKEADKHFYAGQYKAFARISREALRDIRDRSFRKRVIRDIRVLIQRYRKVKSR
jgi:hypothetical protein